jgi:hypothetical protein
LLITRDGKVYGFGRESYSTGGSHIGLANTQLHVFCADQKPAAKAQTRPKPAPKPEASAKRRKRRPNVGGKVHYHWTQSAPVVARGMVLAGGTLFLAGESRDARPIAAGEIARGGKLVAISADDGAALGQISLPAMPVFDGLIAANGKLYLCDRSGQVTCFSER